MISSRFNLDLIDSQYQRWRENPNSVDESWRIFFEGFELGRDGVAAKGESRQQIGIVRLINTYRRSGHMFAHLDPLSDPPGDGIAADLAEFGFTDADLDRTFDTSHWLAFERGTLRELVAALQETYCRSIGVEYMHIQDAAVRRWLETRMEPSRNKPDLARPIRMRILTDLHHGEAFERFLHTRFLGQKRFSLEGAETLIPLLNTLIETCAATGARELVMGMAHRGRLNVLANILGKPYKEIFTEFDAHHLPNSMAGDGDVKYHLGFSDDRLTSTGHPIHLTLTPNPSHLEAVDPLVEGRVRAKQRDWKDETRSKVIPLLIHGDAAFSGQGIIAECLNLSQLQGYKTGGTIHVVVNNQIGFTTRPSDSRSSRYCTDIAKMIEVPIFHVNSEDPEAVMYVARLAVKYRQIFHKDVVIDMYCYRKHGHNEGDEPAYTNPEMVAKIDDKPLLSKIYAQQLIDAGILTEAEDAAINKRFTTMLDEEQQELKKLPHFVFSSRPYQDKWAKIASDYSDKPVRTGVSEQVLQRVSKTLSTVPDDFEPNPKLKREVLDARFAEVHERKSISWGLAESLAFGALLLEGTPIRLSGQDSRRGTFSQRHTVYYDQRDERAYIPLQYLAPDQPTFCVYDSMLSEAAVLGFDFGYSLDSPNSLVMWEAQFGDFANGAQVIIDQFIASSKSKWQRDSGIVMLLPHGYDGQGPEHSSARLERYLQLCAENNMQVCYPSTPAQYFHLLRRQVRSQYRRPLIVMTPKSMLRNKAVVSPLADFTGDTSYREVMDESAFHPSPAGRGAGGEDARAERVILCSGKVYWDLLEQRAKEMKSVAIIRLEQIYPFPAEQIQRILKQYPRGCKDIVWVQEESHNMGAWFFVEPRLRQLGFDVKYIGRDDSASPATGSSEIHRREQRELVRAAFHADKPQLVASYNAGDLFGESAKNGAAEESPKTPSEAAKKK
ncbi:MAG TPA: 2-oxoglutarate dehydrogenase E1 component [Gemmataceae bacterium]|nr:2-oxoglutarate dehydrogenase E1 component [Gemmataceae bacterium]